MIASYGHNHPQRITKITKLAKISTDFGRKLQKKLREFFRFEKFRKSQLWVEKFVGYSECPSLRKLDGDIDLLVDSTGLKVYGAGEWCEAKHGKTKRRKWKKLHIAVDKETQDIVASTLT